MTVSSVGNSQRVNSSFPIRVYIANAAQAKDQLLLAAVYGDVQKVEELNEAFPLSKIDHVEDAVESAAENGKVDVLWKIIDLHGKNANRLFNVALAGAATSTLPEKKDVVLSLLQSAGATVLAVSSSIPCHHPFYHAKPVSELLLSAIRVSFRENPNDPLIPQQLLGFCSSAVNVNEFRGCHLIRSVMTNDQDVFRRILRQESTCGAPEALIPCHFIQCAHSIAKARGDQEMMAVIKQSRPAAFGPFWIKCPPTKV